MVLCTALEIQSTLLLAVRSPEDHHRFSLFHGNLGITVVDHPASLGLVCGIHTIGHQLRAPAPCVHIELDAVSQHISQGRSGLFLLRLPLGGSHPVVILLQCHIGCRVLDLLTEHQPDICVRIRRPRFVPVVAGKLLDHGGGAGVQGMDGDHLNSGGVVACFVLRYIIQVIGLLWVEPADIEAHIFVLAHVHLAAFQGVHPRRNLHLGRITGQVHRAGLPRQRLGVLCPLFHHHPIQGSRLIQIGIEAHRGPLHLVYCGVGVELGRGAVHSREGQLLHPGALSPFHISEPQIQIIALQFLQCHVVHIKGIGGVFGHISASIAKISCYGVGLEVLRRGSLRAFGQQRPVKPAALGRHHSHLRRHICDLGHIGVPIGKAWHRIVRSREGEHLQRTLIPSGIHQHRGKIVGAVGDELADFCRRPLSRPAQGGRAICHDLRGIGGRIDQLIRPHHLSPR